MNECSWVCECSNSFSRVGCRGNVVAGCADAGMSIYFRTVSRWRVTMSRQIFPMSWWVRHAECDKFMSCRNSKPRRTVLYQFPWLTRSMTSECVFVICDMWVWYITFYEWVKRSHNNTNCMILYIQTGLTPSTRHGIVFVVRYGWWLHRQTWVPPLTT